MRIRRILAAGASLTIAAATALAQAAQTPELRREIAALTRAPYTTILAGARSSETAAWVVQRAGAQTLFLATGPDFQPRIVATTGGDSGDTLDNITLSPTGTWVAFTRGPDAAPNGRTPNPAGLTEPMRNALWVAAAGGPPLKVADHGEGPLFSPDSRQLAFTVDGQLRLCSLSSGANGAVLGAVQAPFQDMGGIGDAAWSPKGDTLAFVSNRSSHAFIGMYRLGEDRVRWLSPAVANDASPSWAPDAKRIAFMRYPASSYTDVPDVMRDHKFEIRIADVSTGESRSIYRSPGADAGAQRDLRPRWLKDGRVAFLSDADGFSHLYAVDPVDGRAAQLSHGRCDLESFDVDADGETIAVSGNCFDRFRRDVAIWTPAGGQLQRVSAPQTIASDAIFIGPGRALLYRSATFNRPQLPVLWHPGGTERLLNNSAAETIEAMQEPRVVEFKAPDGTNLSGVLFPARGSTTGGRTAAVVYTHGGPNRQMLPGWYLTPYYAYAYAANQQLALHGITVLAVNYRTGTGFGRAFRTAAGYGPHGAFELQDVYAAAAYLRSLPLVDPSRIGIYGGSFGGHLAANALARRSDEFKAGVAWHGIYDFTQWIGQGNHPNRLPTMWGASESGRALAYESSALAHVATWHAPTLLIAGDDDRHVDFAETVALLQALEGTGTAVETLVLPNEVHGFLRHASWLDVISHTNAFLIDHLNQK